MQDNGEANLAVTANGLFIFGVNIPRGEVYNVTVLTPPSGPVQNCVISNGSGAASADVTNVQINCFGAWTWVSGANVPAQLTNDSCACMGVPGTQGVYGTQGIAAPGNVPGARSGAVSWTDAAGNFWLFGGYGLDSMASIGTLGDLWKYSAGEWTWMSGSKFVGGGQYGTLGVAAPGNTPPPRQGAVAWTDAAGNLWLFGGESGTPGELNDLWKYSAGEWTWMSGSNAFTYTPPVHQDGPSGVYGAQGTAAPGNVPGGRSNAVGWSDAAGNLWLFGGFGQDSIIGADPGGLNDLWKYSAGEWTWISGSNVGSQPGTYGTQGVAAFGNTPGARQSSIGWTDPAGNFWLFGGFGRYSNAGDLNDLWRFTAGEWTWMGGSNSPEQLGVYGAQGVAAAGNVPGARDAAVGWTDAAGNLWLLAGEDINTGAQFNDLWKYSAGEWTWISGMAGGIPDNAAAGIYGVQGTAAAGNTPGARYHATGATDPAGTFFLFGGGGLFNDLWEFEP